MKNNLFKGIQRYNQGFGKFGPLEKCDEGALVKVKDLQKAAEEHITYVKRDIDVLHAVYFEVENEMTLWRA